MYKELDRYAEALRTYITSTYHISHPALVTLREELLRRPAAIAQAPYLESTARYATSQSYKDLELPPEVKALLSQLGRDGVLFDPPYAHQARALEYALGAPHRDLVVTTGTGSGKTETFLLPILGRVAEEAARPSFKTRAVRALLLYPMNALVNDQLGRLRLLFGDDHVSRWFVDRGGRPMKFARYTGKSLYPGRRKEDTNKHWARLKEPLSFFTELEHSAATDQEAKRLIQELRRRGKWPSKPSSHPDVEDGVSRWLGEGHWRDKNGAWRRTIERDEDPELFLRHEAQERVPDLLVTNYSMLEYMLLRPIERGIFKETARYYADNPTQRMILILDEAHLYRGAQGTEVAMLIRRLRHRLGLSHDQLQVICTSASFSDPTAAAAFAAQLSGKPEEGFEVLTGTKRASEHAGAGDAELAGALTQIDVEAARAGDAAARQEIVEGLGRFAAPPSSTHPGEGWVETLARLPVTGRLLNLTSGAICEGDDERDPDGVGPAQELNALSGRLFPGVDAQVAREATDALIELTSMAKPLDDGPPILAARAHAFFRGLPGLWACADPSCACVSEALRTSDAPLPTGALYAQPRRSCDCGARAFELHTCRGCGKAYFNAFTTDPSAPGYLWSEDVGEVDEVDGVVHRLQIALEEPQAIDAARFEWMDPITGRVGVSGEGEGAREIWLPQPTDAGQFSRCPHCGARSEDIMDHVTKGDEPFQELVSAQLLEQPARADVDTPLKGRKALIFSDGRQAASRLAGKLQQFSLRDAVRPLLLCGLEELTRRLNEPATLDHAYLALLIGAALRDVTLRPAQAPHTAQDLNKVRALIERDATARELRQWSSDNNANSHCVNEALMSAIYPVLKDPHTGLRALGLATLSAALSPDEEATLRALPAPPTPTDESEDARRRALLDLWLNVVARDALFLPTTPRDWLDSDAGARIKRAKATFSGALKDIIGKRWSNTHLKPGSPWARFITETFAANETANGFYLKASKVTVEASNIQWRRCQTCTSAQPFNVVAGDRCTARRGKHSCKGTTHAFDPTTHEVFSARKGHFRRHVERALDDRDYAPHPFVAAEHSAALNDSDNSKAVARAEWHELRFQDLDVVGPDGRKEGPIDVLSCTTTMEVGIDIGSLTAVALRNVPPGRANYQQRAGRAGRRGASLSTVITYCGADSHDQEFFSNPAAMVSGPVPDPCLNMDNEEIIRRHCFALIMSLYQIDTIADPRDGEEVNANVFESLGMLGDFREGARAQFSYVGLEAWLASNEGVVEAALTEVTPPLLLDMAPGFIKETPAALLRALRDVGAGPLDPDEQAATLSPAAEELANEADASLSDMLNEAWDDDLDIDAWGDAPRDDAALTTEPGHERGLDPEKLLDRLFERSVLPRYAFPTDVVTFHVFDPSKSTARKASLRYSPQRGLNQALSGYAPGREVWVNGERHHSFAIWTPFRRDRWRAWKASKISFECDRCGYTRVEEPNDQHWIGQALDCPACGGASTLGVGARWMRPPGFAHPVDVKPGLALEDSPTQTRPTRAKLSAPFTDSGPPRFHATTARGAGYEIWTEKQRLILTNMGSRDPHKPGFLYCALCGRAEPNGWTAGVLKERGGHPRPNPDNHPDGPSCNGTPTVIVLGNEFETDVALFRFEFSDDVALSPGSAVAKIVLTTVAEALAAAAATILDIDAADIGAEYRAAMTPGGATGAQVEVYLYDVTPGGAGFVREAAASHARLFSEALSRLEGCDCTHSCYQCLRSYKNKWDHALLDRKLAAAFIRHVTEGATPTIDDADAARALRALELDLLEAGHRVERAGGGLRLPEIEERSLLLGHPLAPQRPGTTRGRGVDPQTPPVIINQLLIDRAPPAALRLATGATSTSIATQARPPLAEDAGGVPVYALDALASGGAPTCRVALPGAPEGAYLAQLTRPTMERISVFNEGAWILLTPTDEGDYAGNQDKIPRLIMNYEGTFNATNQRWTFGVPKLRDDKGDKVKIQYASNIAPRSETVLPSAVKIVARLSGVLVDGHLKTLGGQ